MLRLQELNFTNTTVVTKFQQLGNTHNALNANHSVPFPHVDGPQHSALVTSANDSNYRMSLAANGIDRLATEPALNRTFKSQLSMPTTSNNSGFSSALNLSNLNASDFSSATNVKGDALTESELLT